MNNRHRGVRWRKWTWVNRRVTWTSRGKQWYNNKSHWWLRAHDHRNGRGAPWQTREQDESDLSPEGSPETGEGSSCFSTATRLQPYTTVTMMIYMMSREKRIARRLVSHKWNSVRPCAHERVQQSTQENEFNSRSFCAKRKGKVFSWKR